MLFIRIFLMPIQQQKMKTQAYLFILAFILAVALGQKNLTVTCSSCATNICASGLCFKITGSSFNQTQCVAQGSTCSVGLNTQIQVNNCSVDYSSTNCNRGICFFTLTPIAFLGANCSASYTESISCGTCISNAGCGNSFCQGVTTSPSATAQVGCVSSCSNPANTTRTVQACTNGFDSVGGQNSCCMTFSGTPGAVCITQNSFLSASTYINDYVQGTGTKKSQQFYRTIFICLVAFLAAMAY